MCVYIYIFYPESMIVICRICPAVNRSRNCSLSFILLIVFHENFLLFNLYIIDFINILLSFGIQS